MNIRIAQASALVALVALLGCDDPKKPGPPSAKSAAPAASAKPTAATEAPKPKTMPELTVDSTGPYLGGRRVDLSAADGKTKLAEVIKELPIRGEPVMLLV